MANKNQPMYRQIATDFFAKIADYVANNAKMSYLSPKDVKGEWRQKVPYSAEFEEKLANQAKSFIMMQGIKDTQLLRAAISKIVEFLAKYSMNRDEQTSRSSAERYWHNVLWEENAYIQNLVNKTKERQSRKKAFGRSKSNRYEQAKKHEKFEQQRRKNRQIHKSVQHDVFRVAVIEFIATHRK